MRTLQAMEKQAQFVPGFELALRAEAELVVENAFDQSHFRPVHRVENLPRFRREDHPDGAYAVSGSFTLPTSPWQKGRRGDLVDVPFRATAYSPTIVLSNLGGDHPYSMITTAMPISPTETIARLSLIMPGSPSREDCLYLLEQAKAGLMQDAFIWEGMRRPETIDPVESDAIILGFRVFSDGFRTIGQGAVAGAGIGVS
ncbi:hypothetical protein [Rhizobium sp. FY34]|uniref:hypothetical protein n=1 Tax=Rhizobium sp. FY34 TaxID=2562309 RepID=UPI001FEDD648|nr:hypothetical protein [Rhizobium sp. FY34]